MRYYRITNAEGKSWVMPERNMKVGMMLYQPSSKKGKLLYLLCNKSFISSLKTS